MNFMWVTFSFEILTTITSIIAIIISREFITKNRVYFGVGRYFIYIGLWFETLHFFLDTIDTVIYMHGNTTWYDITDNTEELFAIIGGILLTLGMGVFSNTLIHLWNKFPMTEG